MNKLNVGGLGRVASLTSRSSPGERDEAKVRGSAGRTVYPAPSRLLYTKNEQNFGDYRIFSPDIVTQNPYFSVITILMEQDKISELLNEFTQFVDIVRILREKCPWDKEQTHESLRRCLLEESYEVLEAIDSGNKNELKKELGDVFLQVVFHSIIGEETGDFTLTEVMRQEREKLIERHPHVFGDTKVTGTDEVLVNWEKRKQKDGRASILDGVPTELPALFKAYRIQEKAAKVGFDWKDKEPVFDKIREEIEELKQNVESGANPKEIEEELGDVLFSLVNYARFINVNPEDALRQTVNKFSKRFRKIEEHAKSENRELEDMSLEEMDAIWNKAKENT